MDVEQCICFLYSLLDFWDNLIFVISVKTKMEKFQIYELIGLWLEDEMRKIISRLLVNLALAKRGYANEKKGMKFFVRVERKGDFQVENRSNKILHVGSASKRDINMLEVQTKGT